ncbi:PAS domain-containing protein [Nitrogeniibacter mangrovi]|uniref:PAS domain-containing protein n=1 Tax=Nitrogeniibacter mangrovi TaxID=2016596 RepID=A0A6C1B5P9_9RHOO|nr:PAS domain-containing protein [Nitrogeniibacter mangrovi]QID17564.1 PAS domain-containing protein [Nitrogeniibacter mangrovi]
MKNRIQPTNVEKIMREHDFIVSKTDLKGRLVYGNEIFIEFSGYEEAELLGSQHNIIRHPDMPRGVFRLLWDSISSGKEIFAYVKNMSKDGSYYWVVANVTPDYDDMGKISGYLSVRRAPSRKALPLIEDLYRRMKQAEEAAGPRDACEASIALLNETLKEKGVSYEDFVLAI